MDHVIKLPVTTRVYKRAIESGSSMDENTYKSASVFINFNKVGGHVLKKKEI